METICSRRENIMSFFQKKISLVHIIIPTVLFILVAALFSAAMSLQRHDGNKPFQKSLEGRWKIQIGDQEKYAGSDYNDAEWDDINLPSNMLGYAMGKTG